MRVLIPWIVVLAASGASAGALDDMELRSNVEAAIRGSGPTASLHLKVEVEDGVVRPIGLVKDLSQIDKVIELAGKVRGVKAVERGEMRLEFADDADATIASRVSRTLGETSGLSDAPIRAEVKYGVVTLEGTLKSASKRDDVRRLCATIEGVVEVVDRLASPERPDAAIQKALDAVFGARATPRFPGRISTEVDHGTVVVSGTVPRLFDRQEALRTAWSIDGVRGVVDDLALDSHSSRIKVVSP